MKSARMGDLVLTGGGAGDLAAQVAQIGAVLAGEGMGFADLCLLRVFYRAGTATVAGLEAALAAALPGSARVALTLVPVTLAGAGDLSLEAAAVAGPVLAEVPRGSGPVVFVAGRRKAVSVSVGRTRRGTLGAGGGKHGADAAAGGDAGGAGGGFRRCGADEPLVPRGRHQG